MGEARLRRMIDTFSIRLVKLSPSIRCTDVGYPVDGSGQVMFSSELRHGLNVAIMVVLFRFSLRLRKL